MKIINCFVLFACLLIASTALSFERRFGGGGGFERGGFERGNFEPSHPMPHPSPQPRPHPHPGPQPAPHPAPPPPGPGPHHYPPHPGPHPYPPPPPVPYPYPYYPFYTDVYFDSFFNFSLGYAVGSSHSGSNSNESARIKGYYDELNELEKRKYHYDADMQSLSEIKISNIVYEKQESAVMTLDLENLSQYSITNITFKGVLRSPTLGTVEVDDSFYFSLPQTLEFRQKGSYTVNLDSFAKWAHAGVSKSSKVKLSVISITTNTGTKVPEESFTKNDQKRMDKLKGILGIKD